MSAWLCSDKHIFELAKYYVEKCQQYTSSKLTFKEAALILYNENCNSLAARYGDDYTPIKIPVNYQACEHDEWEASRAKKICETISSYLLSNHPDYDAAPWGI